MKKRAVIILGVILVIIVVILVIFLGDKNLDLESNTVKNLYSYLGEVDIYHCGGLNQYSGDEVTYDSLSTENKMCMAYYELNEKDIIEKNVDFTSINDNDIKICEIGEGIRIAAKEGESKCSYQSFSKSTLENAYKKIYGKSLPDEEQFYISSNEACYLEGENYYCGEAETFIYSLTPEATIYRLVNKAVEKMNDDIVITDYYLRISDNKCYSSSNSDDEISSCSAELTNDNINIDSEFVSKYGAIYEHTYKKDANDNYYWYSSNLK